MNQEDAEILYRWLIAKYGSPEDQRRNDDAERNPEMSGDKHREHNKRAR